MTLNMFCENENYKHQAFKIYKPKLPTNKFGLPNNDSVDVFEKILIYITK